MPGVDTSSVRQSYPSASLAVQAYLADAFRSSQALLAMQMVAQVMAVWKQLNLADVRSSWPVLRMALAQAIRQEFTVSAQQANAYFLESRLAAGVTDTPPVLTLPEMPVQELITAVLDSTGPYRLLASIKAATQPLPQVFQASGTVLAGAATRLVLNGGRQALLSAVQDDQRALAWLRVTASNPCAFCAMLASRGAVYKSEQSAGFQAHGHCRCTAAAVFSENDAGFIAQNNLLQQEWKRVTKGHSGKYALRAWRRYWDKQHPDAPGASESVA
jgi:hypothetical protein